MSLFDSPLRVVNVGLASFADPLRARGVPVASVAFRPPAGGDPKTAMLVARLADDARDPVGALVTRANAEAISRILAARPVLVDLVPLRDAVPSLPARALLHAGPPIEFDRMCGPMRGALAGAAVLEGWAADPAAAERLLASGEIALLPNHAVGAVGPMAGVSSPSMPVFVVRDETSGKTAFSNMNEGLGKVLRFGANGPEVLDRLRHLRDVVAPALAAAIRRAGPIDLRSIIAQALQMGDECHNRNAASTALFARMIARPLVEAAPGQAAQALAYLEANAHFFLNLSMAACKATLDAASGIPGSTVVTAMARNGVEFGLRLSGTGDRWFTAKAEVPDALYFPGYGPEDANPDLGDSAITETAGIGGFAMAAAPAIVKFVGGTAADAIGYTREMETITLARNQDFALPPIDFAGTPTGIDARKVVETAVAPVINTGVAHRLPGVGQIGAGIVRAPLSCFVAALAALGESLEREEGGS